MHDSKYAVLSQYITELHWALVPLHYIEQGQCTCHAGADCRSAGKHPRATRWQEEGQLVRDLATLTAVHDARPESNWGVATGVASGMFAVDFDPATAGPNAYAWGAALDALGGRTHATGGGGNHWFFTLPVDFEPRNVGRKARDDGRIPVGIDIRGRHGMIVLPPSASGKGLYKITRPGPVGPAPSWLVEALRPRERADFERPERSVPIDQLTAGKWTVAAVRGELEALRDAQEGTRNDTAFATACRLIELVNAGWAGLDRDAVREYWWQAGVAHPAGKHVPDAELAGVWARAELRVGDRPAVEPAELPRGELIPFAEARPEMPSGWTGPVGAGESWSGFVDAGGGPDDPAAAMIGRMRSAGQMAAADPPVPLIDGLLDLNTCAWLIGAPGSFKSFVALDFAAHVAEGRTWHGRAVHQGTVVYLAAEGHAGLGLRVAAWEREHGAIGESLRILPEVVRANERTGKYGAEVPGMWSVLVEACRRVAPVLVVIDTQARVTIGLRENDNDDMGYFAEQADKIRKATGATVLVVHHTGRSGGDARGASAIDGAQESELKVTKKGQLRAELRVDKQKDLAEVAPVQLQMVLSDGGKDPTTGRDLSSLVVAAHDLPAVDEEGVSTDGVFVDAGRETAEQRRARALYRLMRDRVNPGEGMTRTEIGALLRLEPEFAVMSAGTWRKIWSRAWTELVRLGLIAQRGGSQRFKVVILDNQREFGFLTPNDRINGTDAPDGFSILWPDGSVNPAQLIDD